VKLHKKKTRKFSNLYFFLFKFRRNYFRNARRNWNEERRVNAETFGLQYRPVQQGGYQRSGYRRNNGRYQRTGNGGYGSGNGGYGNRNANYYGNFNNRVRAY
jgi:hypothetical protein